MRILACHPGASYSTADVFNGYVRALAKQGHELTIFQLDAKLEAWGDFIRKRWYKAGRPPGWNKEAMGVMQAATELVPLALMKQPDWVIIFSAMYYPEDVCIMLRRAGMRVAMLLTEAPFDIEREAQWARWADVAFTNERSCVETLRSVCPNVFYLGAAFDPDVHRPYIDAPDDVPAHDVVFVGTLFQERIDLLGAVDWTGIDFGLYGHFDLLPPRHRLRKYIRGGVQPNARAAALYRKAKIGLNLYRTSKGFGKDVPHITHAESLNPRAVELAACGVFHLSDPRAEVEETFGSLVPTFTDAADLECLIRIWLADDAGRWTVAARLPDCVYDRTFDVNAHELIRRLESASGRGVRIVA